MCRALHSRAPLYTALLAGAAVTGLACGGPVHGALGARPEGAHLAWFGGGLALSAGFEPSVAVLLAEASALRDHRDGRWQTRPSAPCAAQASGCAHRLGPYGEGSAIEATPAGIRLHLQEGETWSSLPVLDAAAAGPVVQTRDRAVHLLVKRKLAARDSELAAMTWTATAGWREVVLGSTSRSELARAPDGTAFRMDVRCCVSGAPVGESVQLFRWRAAQWEQVGPPLPVERLRDLQLRVTASGAPLLALALPLDDGRARIQVVTLEGETFRELGGVETHSRFNGLSDVAEVPGGGALVAIGGMKEGRVVRLDAGGAVRVLHSGIGGPSLIPSGIGLASNEAGYAFAWSDGSENSGFEADRKIQTWVRLVRWD